MRKIFFTLILAAMSVGVMGTIPAGKVIYLDVSQCPQWQNAPSYLIHLSATNMTHVMKPVAGKQHWYSFTTIASTQDNVNFGLAKTAITADFSGWFGSQTSAHIEWNGNCKPQWSEDTPVFQVDCSGSNPTGHGVGLPLDGQVTNVSYSITDIKCVDSTYVINLTVTLSGTANLKIEGSLLSSAKKVGKCESTYETSFKAKWVAGAQQTFVVSACSDEACTNVNNSKNLTVSRPTLECEITTGEIEVCSDKAKDIELKAENSGDSIQWYDGNGTALGHTQSIKVSPKAPKEVYTAKVYESYINPDNNLMVNGDFESGYDSFKSDYEPIKDKTTKKPVVNPTWIYSNRYDNGDQYGKYYCITNDAYDLQESGIFAHIAPHGGDEYLVVDASSAGEAWYTTTAQSPKLVLTAGETYLFSYWVACPNTGAELSKPKAQLQFIIELELADGTKKSAPLTQTYTVGSQVPVNDWYYQETRWTCSYSSNNVKIAVKNNTASTEGNDFCLDDIIFQPITKASKKVSMVEHHPVVVKDCEEKCPEVDIILHDTVVCDTIMPIKWRGRQYDGPKVYRDTIRSKVNAACDSIIIIDSLVTERCGDCEYIVYAKWDDVLFVNNGPTGLQGKAMTYAWYCDGKLIPDANAQSYYNPGGMEGHVFMAEVMLEDSSIVTSCEFAFDTFERSADANPGIDPRKPVVEEVYQVFGRMKVIRRRYDDGTMETEKVWELY